MKHNRIRTLIEQAAGNAGIPDTLIRDIVPLAQRNLKASSHGLNPKYRDVIWAVDRARREWGHRFLSALDARCAQSDASLNSSA